MKYYAFYILVFTIIIHCCFSCNNHESVPSNDLQQIDSITIVYERLPGLILKEPATYRDIIYYHHEREDGYYSITIKDSIGLSRLSVAIDSLVTINESLWWDYVSAQFALLIYKQDIIDTIGLDFYPGRVQVKDVKYKDKFCKDSLLWLTTIGLVEERDSLWKKSFYGATNPLINR